MAGVLAPFSDIDLLFLTAEDPRRRRCAWSSTCSISCGFGLKSVTPRGRSDCLVEGARTPRSAPLARRPLHRRDSKLFTDFHQRSARPARKPALPNTSRRSRTNAPHATVVTATARSWSSRTSRKAVAACATSRRCTGSPLLLRHANHGRTCRCRRCADARGSAARATRLGIPVDCAVPPAHVAGRAEERLTFDMQPVVGARMGYTPARQAGRRRALHAPLLPDCREVVRLTRILERHPARRVGLRPSPRNRQGPGGIRFPAREGKLLPIGRPATSMRTDPDATHPASGARRGWSCTVGAALDGAERAPGDRTARRSEGRGHLHGPDVRREPEYHRGGHLRAASRRGALAVGVERDRVPRPLIPTGRASSARCSSTPITSSPSMRHDRSDPRAERHGARRTVGGRAGRLGTGRAFAIAARAVPGDAAARHRQGTWRRPLANRRGDRTGGRAGTGPDGGGDRDGSWLVLHHLMLSQTAFKRDIDDRRPSSTWQTPSSRRSGCGCC